MIRGRRHRHRARELEIDPNLYLAIDFELPAYRIILNWLNLQSSDALLADKSDRHNFDKFDRMKDIFSLIKTSIYIEC